MAPESFATTRSESAVQKTPLETLQTTSFGYIVARCLHAVADFGVADALDESPQSPEELATAVGVDPGALGRILRLLSAHGVFEHQAGRYQHSPASRLLRTDHPQSQRAFLRMNGLPIFWTCYADLHHSLRTGLPVAPKVVPEGFWKYFGENPEEARLFDEAMTAKAQAQISNIVRSYDFSSFGVIADIGGGRGHLIQAVLAANPKAKGVLFDLPHVIEKAAGTVSDRLRLQPGSFFTDDLPVCDAYILMDIIHDWNDEDSAKILKNLRRAARPGAELLLIEAIVPDDSNPSFAKLVDVHMLVLLGGRQRTQREHVEFLAKADFRLQREIAVGGDFSILEAVAV